MFIDEQCIAVTLLLILYAAVGFCVVLAVAQVIDYLVYCILAMPLAFTAACTLYTTVNVSY